LFEKPEEIINWKTWMWMGDSIKMGLKETGWETANWIHMVVEW
jgi:hypothetical protein